MEEEIAAGRVDLTVDPSFLVEPKDEDVDPLDVPKWKPLAAGYLDGASIDQIARYKERTCTELEAYEMQRHLHFHRISKQGFISICRDFGEVDAFRNWSFRVAYKDDIIHSEDEMDLDYGWPVTQEEKSMPDQEELWFFNFDKRAKRLAKRRRNWNGILRKRAKQRADIIKAETAMDKQSIRRRRREEERRAQLRADRAHKELQDHIMYCHLFTLLKDKKADTDEGMEESQRGSCFSSKSTDGSISTENSASTFGSINWNPGF